MQVRSHESLLDEAKMITQEKDFKGYIHDVGGPDGELPPAILRKTAYTWRV